MMLSLSVISNSKKEKHKNDTDLDILLEYIETILIRLY